MKTIRMYAMIVCLLGPAGRSWASPFPITGGTNLYPSSVVSVEIEFLRGGGPIVLDLTGPTTIGWDAGVEVPGGRDHVDTEIVSMSLTGSSVLGPVSFGVNTSDPSRRSTGQVQELSDGGMGEVGSFPSASFFDLFFEIDTPEFSTPVFNLDPVYMHSIIGEIPPNSATQYLGLGWREFDSLGDFAFDPDNNSLHHEFGDAPLWLFVDDPNFGYVLVGWMDQRPTLQLPEPGTLVLSVAALGVAGLVKRRGDKVKSSE
ncbi:MAG: PEP-CTERM sorting domain-containing protein [Phycisphaerae bacterium]